MKNKKFIWSSLFTANKLFIFEIWKCNKLYYLFQVISLLFNAGLSIAWVYFPKLFIDSIMNKKDFPFAIGILLIISSISILWNLANEFISGKLRLTIGKVNTELKTSIIKKISSTKFDAFDDPLYHDQIQKAMNFIDSSGDQLIQLLGQQISAIISMIGIGYIITQVNWLIILIFMVCIIISFFISKQVNQKWFDFQYGERTRRFRFIQFLASLFASKEDVAEMKLNNGTKFMSNYLKDETVELVTLEYKKAIDRYKLTFISQFLNNIQEITLYIYFGFELFIGKIDFALYSTLFAAARQFTQNLSTVLDGLNRLRSQALEASNYIDFISNVKYETPKGKQLITAETFESIEFKNVTFKYLNQEKNALDHISAQIKKGEKVAIVGKNGSGKSTFIKLLLGFYQPQHGEITVNGINISQIDPQKWLDLISTVFQDFQCYPISIKNNICFNPDCDYIKLQTVLEQSCLSDKIKSLPKEMDTILSKVFNEAGTDFSRGEKQKVAIGRALYKNAPIFILDEPSSALDPDSEYKLFKLIQDNTEDKTVVFISHRLSTTVSADKILVFDNGQIVESGTHKQLMNNKGLYWELFNEQAEKYIDNTINLTGC